MVYLLLADGFEDIEAVTPIDILRRAGIPLATVGVTGKRVTSKHGLVVEADIVPDSVDRSDLEMLILPGGPGVDSLAASQFVQALTRETAQEGRLIGAICAAPRIPAELGLLAGRRAVCFPSCEETLILHGAHLQPERQVVVDLPFITAKAAGSALDFALALVSALRGQSLADEVRDEVCYRL